MTTKHQEKTALDPDLSQPDWSQEENQRVLAAMCRAAKKARQQAIDDEGYVATWRDGQIVYDTEA